MVTTASSFGNGTNSPTPPTKESMALWVANAHRGLDSGITKIFRLVAPGHEASPAEPVKLLEVNENTTVSGIVPVYFTPHPATGLHYPTIIVEVHPSEFDLLQDRKLALPNGWQLDYAL